MLRELKALFRRSWKLHSHLGHFLSNDRLRLPRKPSTPSNQYLVPHRAIGFWLVTDRLWKFRVLLEPKAKTKPSSTNLRICVNKWPRSLPLSRDADSIHTICDARAYLCEACALARNATRSTRASPHSSEMPRLIHGKEELQRFSIESDCRSKRQEYLLSQKTANRYPICTNASASLY